MRRRAGNLFIEHRNKVELTIVAVLVAGFLLCTGDSAFDETMSDERRGRLCGSLAGTAAALLGFSLAGLSILIALTSNERLDALRKHPSWPRVPGSYLRAACVLLLALVLRTVGIALDSAEKPWVRYEVATLAVLALALARIATAVLALDQLLLVARQHEPRAGKDIDDPGP